MRLVAVVAAVVEVGELVAIAGEYILVVVAGELVLVAAEAVELSVRVV